MPKEEVIEIDQATDAPIGSKDKAQPKATTYAEGPPLYKVSAESDSSLDSPLVSVSINNPFKKLLHWLDQIRRKQTTTFNLKIQVPLIALPIFLILIGGALGSFFNLGKIFGRAEIEALPTPTPVVIVAPTAVPIVTKAGTLKAAYQVKSLLTPTAFLSATPSGGVSPSVTPSRFVLVSASGQITFLASKLDLSSYVGRKVLLTGEYSKSTLTILRFEDIELLP